jgi:hypothetical protein
VLKKVSQLMLCTLAIVAMTVLTLTVPASANTKSPDAARAVVVTSYAVPDGTNGQQIILCNTNGSYYKAYISGKNQNGETVNSPAVILNNEFNCVALNGYWWKGTVKISWWRTNIQYDHATYCTIPTNQGSNYYDCYP